MRRFFVALILFLSCGGALPAFSQERSSGLRIGRPIFLGLGFGNPAPAWIGSSLGFQLKEDTQLLVSYGRFWSGDLGVKSFEGALRFQLFPTAFSPAIGAGINSLHLNGNGSLQTLEESSLLISLFLGFDWIFDSNLRILGGVNFHVPLRLNFPTICVGWSF